MTRYYSCCMLLEREIRIVAAMTLISPLPHTCPHMSVIYVLRLVNFWLYFAEVGTTSSARSSLSARASRTSSGLPSPPSRPALFAMTMRARALIPGLHFSSSSLSMRSSSQGAGPERSTTLINEATVPWSARTSVRVLRCPTRP